MKLPNLSKTIRRLSQDVTLSRITKSVIDHKVVESETSVAFKAVVQPAQKNKLNKAKLDFNLKYILVHSLLEVKISDIIVHHNIRYKAFENADYNDYGYYEIIMEEQK
jgi:hypothetical protein